ncbi:MAG: hypothetical protein MKZ77_08470 [Acidimicrobiales bacterium]|nr:hypothetical protein [Acidimicrobiales bacterium]
MSKVKNSPLSLQWWFEDRATGKIVVAQRPNLLIGACIVGLVATKFFGSHSGVLIASKSLWLLWSADELLRGVNPWRRSLGVFVGAVTILV